MKALRLCCTVLLLAAPSVFAQATRTWISGVGDDLNPCSRTAPCATLAGTLPKTAAGGEINLLDATSLGEATITRSITITAAHELGGAMDSPSVTGLIINAPNGVVTLRGLTFEANQSGTSGVRLVGSGPETILLKEPMVKSKLVVDSDWFDQEITIGMGEIELDVRHVMSS